MGRPSPLASLLERRRPITSTVSVGERVAVSALRARLDDASTGVAWSVNPDGVLGRVMRMPAGAAVTYGLALSGQVSLSARAMLLPHDWRDRRGAVRTVVDATGPDGTRELWSTILEASDRDRPRGRIVQCEIPASTSALRLSVQPVRAEPPYPLTRAIWVNPTIIDPQAPPRPRPAQHAPPPSTQDQPLISVLTPVHDPPPALLEQTIASVRNQTYPHWELCLVDDGSSNPQIISALQRHAASDPRIHLIRRDTAGGISTATNTALHQATGHYIALLDHDDTLTPDALQHVADQINTNPELDMLYSDEDVVGERGLLERHPKPGWSPEHMATAMYTCHLGVYRRDLALGIGGFESRFDGCQDYDLVLRLAERTDRIAHIPRVLYHWHAHAESTAGGDQAKPYAYLAQPGAISEHLSRRHIDADVQFAQLPGLHRVVHRVESSTSVDLVLALSDTRGLSEAATSWLTQPHPTWNVVIAAPAPTLSDATTILSDAGIPHSRITTIPVDPQQNPAAALAAAADAATAEHLILMPTLAAGLTHDWLTRLLGYSQQDSIGAAGPIILAPDGRIHQAGIALPDGIPLHLLHGVRSTMDRFFGFGTSVYNLSAVSGILATPRTTYHTLSGLNPAHKDLALIDYCLRAGDIHQRTVIVPDARLQTTAPDTTTNDLPALWHLRTTWAQTHTHDPYYNPNYRTDRGDLILSRFD